LLFRAVHCTLYLCRNFSYQGRPVLTRQLGRWAACYSCRRLLEKGNTSSLARRSKREVGLYRALLINIIPGQSWSVHQVAPKVSAQAKGAFNGSSRPEKPVRLAREFSH
jgi:hypothetical protein